MNFAGTWHCESSSDGRDTGEQLMSLNAASIMTRQVITVQPGSTVAEVARLLTDHDISAAPVCDDDGTILGMISEGDLVRPFREARSLRRAWWLGVLSFGAELAQSLAGIVRLTGFGWREQPGPEW
jgi:CBS-domain-containing membrane protein